MGPEPATPTPLFQAVRLHTAGPSVRVSFELVRPWTGQGIFVAGLRVGDAEHSIIRHLTVTLSGGKVSEVATYDLLTGQRTLHGPARSFRAGTCLTARFPQSSLAGLGKHPRITAFSTLDGHELQASFPVDRHGTPTA